MQDVSGNTDPEYVDYNIPEWNFIRQSFKCKNVLIQRVVQLTMNNGGSRSRVTNVTFPTFQMVAATLEVFFVNRRRLPTGLYIHPDRPYDAGTKQENILELIIPIVDCSEHGKYEE